MMHDSEVDGPIDTATPLVRRVAMTAGAVVLGVVGLAYAVHERHAAQNLAAQNQQETAELNAQRNQIKDLAAQMNALEQRSQQEAAAAQQLQQQQQQAAERPIVHRLSKPRAGRVAEARWKKMQAQLDAQGKEIAETRGDLDSTRTELTGSIAKTHDELVVLEKRGQRNYFEFDLNKSKQYTKQTSWVAKARDDCNQAVSLGNAGADGHLCVGLIDAGTGQYEQAAQEYQKAIELDPGSERGYVGLADAYTRLNRLSDAEETWRQAVAANPNSVLVYERLGIFFLQQAEYAKAADNFQKAITLAPESYIDYSNLGAADLYLGNDPAAIAAFQQSIKLHPAPGAYANLGTAYYQSRNFAEAARNYEVALRYNPRDPDMWGNLADADHFSGQQSKAIDAYKKQAALLEGLLKINPRDAERQGEIASCYADLGDKAQATAHLALSLEYGRGNKNLLHNAAVVYNDLGETGEALEWLQKALLAGYSASLVRDSPEFDNLRGNSQFQQLLSRALVHKSSQ